MNTDPVQPFRLSSFSSGMIAGVNESLKPAGSVRLSINFDFEYEIGAAATRLGTFIVGGQMVAGKSILGLHNHTEGSTVSKLFSALNDTGDATAVIYDQEGNVVVTGLTANKKVRFLTYMGATLAINGADAERSFTNSGGWITSGGAFDLANMPGSNLNNLCEVFLDRVYLAGDTANPARLYYSGVQTGGSVSWTNGNGFVDIEAGSNRGPITALGRVPGYILIFKTRGMTRWNFTSAFPEELISVGTPSQESVVSAGGVCAFYSNSSERDRGFYMTNGSIPVPISHNNARPIRKWIDAIPASAEANIAGRATAQGFAWSVGNLTVEGQLYRNVELCYNRVLNQWSARVYPQRFTVYKAYIDGQSRNVTVAGTDNGEVIELDRPERFVDYVTKDGEPGEQAIGFDIRSQQEKHGFNQKKIVRDKLVYETRFGKGATPYIVVDGGKKVVEGKKLTEDVGESKLPENPKGSFFEYGLRGTVQGTERLILKEIEVPNVEPLPTYE